MSARQITLVNAIKEIFEADIGPHHWSEITARIESRYPGQFVLSGAYFRETLNRLLAGGYLAKTGDKGYFRKA
jgi:hypothetical protein